MCTQRLSALSQPTVTCEHRGSCRDSERDMKCAAELNEGLAWARGLRAVERTPVCGVRGRNADEGAKRGPGSVDRSIFCVDSGRVLRGKDREVNIKFGVLSCECKKLVSLLSFFQNHQVSPNAPTHSPTHPPHTHSHPPGLWCQGTTVQKLCWGVWGEALQKLIPVVLAATVTRITE